MYICIRELRPTFFVSVIILTFSGENPRLPQSVTPPGNMK